MMNNDILKEEYLDEEAHGFKHDSTGALIPKRDENGVAVLPASWDDDDWDEDEWNSIVDKLQEGYVQRYTEEGVPIETNEDGWGDEDWEGVV